MKSVNRNVCIKLRRIYQIVFLLISVIFYGCTEPFDIENENLEDFLVVNATITDQQKKQQILLSRTIGFNDGTPATETGATIVVTEGETTEYSFPEIQPGVYESVLEFGVVTGKEYQLSIKTRNGRSYISKKVVAPQSTSIDDIYIKRITNNDGIQGVGIFLNSSDPSGNSRYYRFAFEETYRVTAPCWISVDIESFVTVDGIGFRLIQRPENQKVCYKTQASNNINILNTTGLTEDRVQDLPISFIPADNISVAERYSILVKQYVQTREAQSFYKVLSDFSESDNVFSQIQPGFIVGNIFLENDPDTKALGYFDVSSVSEKRLFFDRHEFLADLPMFELDCSEVILPEVAGGGITAEIIQNAIFTNKIRLKVPPFIPPPGLIPDPITFVPRACGDCTALGEADAPDFWVD